jgi:tetratricopeptide (TPR) repeat protein
MKRTLVLLLVGCIVEYGFGQEFLAKAKVSLAARDTTAAITQFEQAIKAGQKPGEAHYTLGAIALARHNVPDAIRHLEEAVRIDDEHVDALRLLGDAYVANKNLSAALTQFRRVVKLAPKNGAVAASYGKALLAADSLDAAIVQLTRAKEYTPDDPTLYEALGDAFVKHNVVPMVISNYQRAIELDSNNTEYRIKLATVLEKSRQYTESVREFDEILKRDSTNADAYRQKGNIYVRAKMYKQAVAPLRKFTELRPVSVEGSVLYTKALSGAGDYDQTIVEGKRSLKLDSNNVDIWRLVAQAQVENKLYQDALDSYDALKRRKAFETADQGQYGLALFRLGRDEESMNSLLAAVATDSTNCDAYFSLGSIYMKKRDYVKAAEMFDKRIECDPKSISLAAYLNGAASHMQNKNYVRTRELLTKTIELKPDFLQARLWLARYYTQVDSLENARSEYDEVLRQIGTNTEKYKREAAEAHYLLGTYYFRKQQFGSAAESFRRASSFGYDDASMRLTWGQAILQTLDRQGDQEANDVKIQESIRHFRRVSDLEPGNAQGHLWLAQGLIQSRKEGEDKKNQEIKEEACNELRKALKYEPRNEDAKKAMERIGCPGAK